MIKLIKIPSTKGCDACFFRKRVMTRSRIRCTLRYINTGYVYVCNSDKFEKSELSDCVNEELESFIYIKK